MAAIRLRNQIIAAFKMHGLTLRSEANKYLVEVLTSNDDGDRAENIERLIEAIQKQPLESTIIDRGACELAVDECNQEQEEETDKVLTVIEAFSIPRFDYDIQRKKFLPAKASHGSILHSGASTKSELFRERYTILHQRTSRHDLFTPSVIVANPAEKSNKFQLKTVEYLLGSTVRLGDIIVLGMLTQMKEGKWFLEDTTGAVQLDLSQANFHTGLFTENCFVLAEGSYEDEVFHVNAFGFPPPENSKTTRAFVGNLNFFGGPTSTSVKTSAKLRQLEQENEDAMFVFVSDVWLDDIKVMKKLRVLFTGYAESPPTCFVLCGNFTSQPYGQQHIKTLKESFHALAEMLSEFPLLVENSRFIFVPGPQDPGPGQILPRPAIPDCITEELREKVPSAVFTSNPCRIQYCTQEIVVFREDIIMKMSRNCVHYPSDNDIPSHFAKTVICQGHLCPLPLHVEPIYWAYDYTLRTYPLPDLIVCADKHDPFSVTQVECTVTNPGSFPRSNYSFMVYWPTTKQLEVSRIENQD